MSGYTERTEIYQEKSPDSRYVKLQSDIIGRGGQKKYIGHMIHLKVLKLHGMKLIQYH